MNYCAANIDLKDGQITRDGFLHLNQMEAEENQDNVEELWMALDSLGFNRALVLDEVGFRPLHHFILTITIIQWATSNLRQVLNVQQCPQCSSRRASGGSKGGKFGHGPPLKLSMKFGPPLGAERVMIVL